MENIGNNEHIFLIINRYLTDECTDLELTELRMWLEESQENRCCFADIAAIKSSSSVLDDPLFENKKQKMLFRLNNRIDMAVTPEKKKRRFNYGMLGAVALIIVVLGVTYFANVRRPENKVNVFTYVNTSTDITPVSLEDGSEVMLCPDSRLEYELAVSHGSRNSGSKRLERRVTLTGNAYFDVARDTSRPFIVNADAIAVRVLGTKFIVESHPDSSKTSVYLQEGSVRLETLEGVTRVRMKEDQKAVFDKDTDDLQIEDMEVDSYFAGHFNKISLINKSIEDIIQEVSRIYGVAIHYEPVAVPPTTYTFNFMRTDPVDEVLDFLGQLTGSHFTIERE